ncbi:DNA-binding response OmpR family regulator [Paenibacillus shirakamiensis]|uniref:DNA-binding response OmpR family regulator n=1 Tax=Paenibacillus shirakamiensis TaxID=1265935 RepID=A0ABS4JEF3_9BACL|nr:response regulator transcription factor [Paenibacillus shirakamiensis]MBP2000090.1 DNA-binding response OmpR family regulator [Paenibacillus shirakamiensis]
MPKILIIEDETVIADLEKDYLEVSGYNVDIEYSGDKGLKRILEDHYDLLILDIMLPVIDGYDICKQVRAKKDIPILMVSAKQEEVNKIKGLVLGADDYIIKPFSPSELVARVNAHLARYNRLTGNREQARDEIRIRGMLIDRSARRVFVNGTEVILTGKEFELLTCMAEHPNQVFSKERLLKIVWGMDVIVDTATVAVHIKNLRKKIELDRFDSSYIETIWGIGYRFTK